MRKNLTSSIVLALFIVATTTNAQTPNGQYRIFRAPREIPEASLPCSPEEETWWQAVRKAGNAVRRSKGGKKELTNFTELLNEGEYPLPTNAR